MANDNPSDMGSNRTRVRQTTQDNPSQPGFQEQMEERGRGQVETDKATLEANNGKLNRNARHNMEQHNRDNDEKPQKSK